MVCWSSWKYSSGIHRKQNGRVLVQHILQSEDRPNRGLRYEEDDETTSFPLPVAALLLLSTFWVGRWWSDRLLVERCKPLAHTHTINQASVNLFLAVQTGIETGQESGYVSSAACASNEPSTVATNQDVNVRTILFCKLANQALKNSMEHT